MFFSLIVLFCLFFSWFLGVSLRIRSERESVCCSPRNCNPLSLCWNPDDVAVMCQGGVVFCDVMIKSQHSSRPELVVCVY